MDHQNCIRMISSEINNADKRREINDFLNNSKKGFKYANGIYKLNEKSIDAVYDLLINNIERDPDNDSEVYTFYATHYKIKENYGQMKKYLNMAIEKKDCFGMLMMGDYYDEKGIYDKMEKYYLMAIEQNKGGSNIAIIKLAAYYQSIGEIDQMIKYYNMGIERGHDYAIMCLGAYYEDVGNVEMMMKYYLMGVEKGCAACMLSLGKYYANIDDTEQMEKYHLMAHRCGNENGMRYLADYYEKKKDYAKVKEYLIKCIIELDRSTRCKRRINEMLATNFDIDLALDVQPCLDNNNMARLNKAICRVLYLANDPSDNMNDIVCHFCCVLCKKEDVQCVYLECGHTVCYRCYGKAKCSLCYKPNILVENIRKNDDR